MGYKHSNYILYFCINNIYQQYILIFKEIKRWAERNTSYFSSWFFHIIDDVTISQTFFKVWDFILMLILLGEIIFVSLKISFESYMSQSLFDMIQIPFLVFLCLDILLCFFKGYQDKGVFQTQTRLCFKNYFQGYFFFDSICLLSYLPAYYSQSQLIYCIFLFRLTTKYYRYQQNIIETLQLNEIFGNEIVKLSELVFTIILLAHLFSCVWYWVGYKSFLNKVNNSSESDKKSYVSWIEAYDLDSRSWQEKYVASLFWVFTTMTTIGFGDIVPQDQQERLVAICIMILSCFIFAYSVNSIGVLLNAIHEKETIHRYRLKFMNSYMNNKKISETLQSKVRCYLDYIYQEEKNGASQNESQSLECLNRNLKDQLLIEANFQVLMKMKIFNVNNYPFSQQFLQDLSIFVQEKIYFPDDIIFRQGQIDPQIYFVEKGQAKMIVKKSAKDQNTTMLQELKVSLIKQKCFLLIIMKLFNIQIGSSFGQYNFFSGQETLYSTIATSVTTIKYLKHSDFLKIVKQYPEDFEKYCMLKESLLLQQNFDMLQITCSLCSWGNHQEINCSLINYKPQKNLVLCKFDHSKPMSRNKNFQRAFSKKMNSYSLNLIVTEQIKEFQEEKGMLIQEESYNPQYSHPYLYQVNQYNHLIPQTPHIDQQYIENKNQYIPILPQQNVQNQTNIGFKEHAQYVQNNINNLINPNSQNILNISNQQNITPKNYKINHNINDLPLQQTNNFLQERDQTQIQNSQNYDYNSLNKKTSIHLNMSTEKCIDPQKQQISIQNTIRSERFNSKEYQFTQTLITQDPIFPVAGTNILQGFQSNEFVKKNTLPEKTFDIVGRKNSKNNYNYDEVIEQGSLKNIQKDNQKYISNQNRINSFQYLYNQQDEIQINQKPNIGSKPQVQSETDINCSYNQGINQIQSMIKGDANEIDKLYHFATYRHKDNYIFHIEQYNQIQESRRSKLLIASERKSKRRVKQKTSIFNLSKDSLPHVN